MTVRVSGPGELGRDRLRRAGAEPVIARGELREAVRVGVERRRRSRRRAFASFCGLAGAQALGQRAPEAIQPGVRHLEHAADVGGLGPVEEQRRSRACWVDGRPRARACPARPARRRSRVALRGCRPRRSRSASPSSGPAFASSEKTPSSTALSSVFEPQKREPSCMIASGVTSACSTDAVSALLIHALLFSRTYLPPNPCRPSTPSTKASGEVAKPCKRRWAILDSNQGPPPYQRGALTD